MICPKCGNDCKNAKYCSNCGEKLHTTCRSCGTVLLENQEYCPNCGTPKKKDNSSFCVVCFIIALLIPIFSILNHLSIRGMFTGYMFGYRFRIPMYMFSALFIGLDALEILFLSLFRTKNKKWLGVFAIIFAVIIKIFDFGSFGSFIALLATILLFALQDKKAA